MEMKEILRIIKTLASVRAPSGLEKARAELFKKELEKYISPKNLPVKQDSLGNCYVKFDGRTGKKAIAIMGHLDEIGGTIRTIKENGTLGFSKRGGYEGRWLISRKVQILNKEGKWITGVIGGRSAHATPEKLRVKEKIDALELEIFIGATNEEEALKDYQIHIGAPFVFSGEFDLLNPSYNDDIISGYSMDNLTALTCLVILTDRIIKNLIDDVGTTIIPYDTYLVGTVREEVGTEGSHYFVRNNPIDKVIGIDIVPIADFSGSVSSGIQLRKGPVIIWQEFSGYGVFDYYLCKTLMEIAEQNKIDYQNGVVEYYGSDAGKVQKWLGIPSALVGIPALFSHNVPEISTLSGINAASDLIYTYLKNLK